VKRMQNCSVVLGWHHSIAHDGRVLGGRKGGRYHHREAIVAPVVPVAGACHGARAAMTAASRFITEVVKTCMLSEYSGSL